MDEKALFLKFWEKEAPATRKVISRIPEGSNYRPDPKSRTAREIAWLIVREESSSLRGSRKARSNGLSSRRSPPSTRSSTPTTVITRISRKDSRPSIPRWERRVPFVFQGQEVMNETGYDTAWGFLLDIIHHRGQLSAYLRPMGSTVPQIYGPSADEPM